MIQINSIRLSILALSALGAVALAIIAPPAWADCGFAKGDWKAGDKDYHQTCVACHGEDGKGTVPGTPDFTKKGGALAKPHEVVSKHIKNGFESPGAALSMPPKGGNPDLTDEDIEDVHAYLHHRYGCG